MASTISHAKGTVLKTFDGHKSLYQTPSPFEKRIGYYRAVRYGSHIFVSGTTAVDPTSSASAPQIKYPDDAGKQCRVAFEECLEAVRALGGSLQSVVRVRMFVSRHEDCGQVGEAFRFTFAKDGETDQGGEVGVAATMIVVRDGFVNADMLVELEMDAMVDH